MRRRDLITLLGTAAAAWPLPARAQQGALPVIGFISGGSPGTNQNLNAAVKKGLGQIGYVEGRDVAFEYRLADYAYDRLPAMAAELVNRRVAVIFASGIPAARAAKAATSTIPIVFAFGEDPVQEGIVTSLNRPGGNITGFSWLSNQLISKRVALLAEILPKASVFAMLVDPRNPVSRPDTDAARKAASALGRSLEVLSAASENEIEAAFGVMVERHVGALYVDSVPFFVERSAQVVAMAARYRIPAAFDQRLFADAGGLMSYSADQEDTWRQAGIYVGRILKGEKPGELPAQQATKLEFLINLKTAKAIGLEIPPTVVALADEVIE
jgi:putative ABC transport system substrate-binding protein